jgi:REP element-mobilizing transposase RayT
MARPVRIEFAGAIYHVSSRMIGSWRDRRERLFRDDRDCQRFLQRLEQNVSETGVRLYLFCLMSNHFHLVLETPEANLSGFMHRLTTAYRIYNLRHQRRSGRPWRISLGPEPTRCCGPLLPSA